MTRQYKGMQEELLSRVTYTRIHKDACIHAYAKDLIVLTRCVKMGKKSIFMQINKLEETVQELRDCLSDADVRLERTLKEKNAIIEMKDKEIDELRAKMDDMAEEFGEMLRETLEKMRERIEVTSGNFETPDVPIQRRMEEMKLSDD